jgi:hypothetical protein
MPKSLPHVVSANFVRDRKIFSIDALKNAFSLGCVNVPKHELKERGYDGMRGPVYRVERRRMIVLMVWSRDCDMAERTQIVAIPATRRHFKAYCEYVQENYNEGPSSVTIMRPEEIEYFKPSMRDRALEAFEDGHDWIVY